MIWHVTARLLLLLHKTYQLPNIINSSVLVISFDFQLRNYIETIAELILKRKVIVSNIPSLSKSLVRIILLIAIMFGMMAAWAGPQATLRYTAPLLWRPHEQSRAVVNMNVNSYQVRKLCSLTITNRDGLDVHTDGRKKWRNVGGMWQISRIAKIFKNWPNSNFFFLICSFSWVITPSSIKIAFRDKTGLSVCIYIYLYICIYTPTCGQIVFTSKCNFGTNRSYNSSKRTFWAIIC